MDSLNVFIAKTILFTAIYLANPDVPCDRSYQSALVRPALHASFNHLLLNMATFYAISQSIESHVGVFNFVLLIAFMWLVTSMFDVVFNLPCSIGFSGIILGLIVWDLFNKGALRWDFAAFSGLVLIWLQPLASGQRNVSMHGHLYGIVAGLLAVLVLPAKKLRSSAYLGPVQR